MAPPSLTSVIVALMLNTMDVQFTPDQQNLVRQAIESGRLHDAADAVRAALSLWEERERARADLITSLDEAEASIDRGEGIIVTPESMYALAEDVKHRGRARLAGEHTVPR